MVDGVEQLNCYVRSRVPDASLILTILPQAPAITLWLLAADYPQENLSQDSAIALMDSPPYWSFCWASGQVLAAEILANPESVQGRIVIDFGTGSGVVAIAAALAGAAAVVAIDEDPMALKAAGINAIQNGVTLHLAASLQMGRLVLEQLLGELKLPTTVCIADVFYDRDNLPLLDEFTLQFDQILVADSRLHGRELPAVTLIKQVDSFTVPDLNESSEFNRVSVYQRTDLDGALEG